MKYLNEKLDVIDKLINNNDGEKACLNFFDLIKQLEKCNHENLPQLYFKFAFLLFDNCFYEDCILMLNNAYMNEYMKLEIKEFIFTSFIIPNTDEFQKSFSDNVNAYMHRDLITLDLSYETLKLEFIPVGDNKYYIYDLEDDTFNNFIDFSEQSIKTQKQIELSDMFSDILIIDDHNLTNIKTYAIDTINNNIYYLSSNPLKTLSFFKLPNILNHYLNNVIIFESSDILQQFFRKNETTYLPHLIISDNDSSYKNEIDTIIKRERDFRLSSKERENSNILLSICIPTYNRGHRALQSIKHLLTLNYDSEIEFVISNNGSDQYVNEYNEIKELHDSRISYFEFESNQGFLKNVCQVLDLAKGKYAIIISDEDLINLSILPNYLRILKSTRNLGVLRSGTSSHYNDLTQVCIDSGDEAFLNFFLNNNYLTGVIYNLEILKRQNLTSLLLSTKDNLSCNLYPHMWIDSFMLFEGSLYKEPSILCVEGSAEDTHDNSDLLLKKSDNLNNMNSYQTYESRIKQHFDFIELINKLPFHDYKTYILSYIQLCWKTHYLISMKKNEYLNNGYDWNKIYNEIYECCIDGIDKLNIELNLELKKYIADFITKENQKYRIY